MASRGRVPSFYTRGQGDFVGRSAVTRVLAIQCRVGRGPRSRRDRCLRWYFVSPCCWCRPYHGAVSFLVVFISTHGVGPGRWNSARNCKLPIVYLRRLEIFHPMAADRPRGHMPSAPDAEYQIHRLRGPSGGLCRRARRAGRYAPQDPEYRLRIAISSY